jgi:ABC-2 type transport system ATP-binding protein
MNDYVLECKDLSKHYKGVAALDGVNINLKGGSITGLLGPNGSGKTTLIKLANGLLQPSAGNILVCGKPIGPETKEFVSYLPDRVCLDLRMKVEDAMDFYADFYDDFDWDTALKMIKNLNLDYKKQLKTLSKGNQEKVQLILVMARRAKLYLLDEPIGGVDPAARDYILNTILSNYSGNATVLISTHLIQDVEQILNDIIFLKEGKVVLEGNANDIRTEKNMSIDSLFREVFRC